VFSIQCAFDEIICANRKLFLMPWAYMLGMEAMLERIASSNTNFFTLNTDQAKEQYNSYQVDFNNELKNAIDGIDLDMNDACIECNQSLKVIDSKF
jgi:hypothetical protein